MSYPFYYPVVPSSYVPSSMSVNNNHEVGYKWYQSLPSSDMASTDSITAIPWYFTTMDPSLPPQQVCNPTMYYPVEYRPPEPPPLLPHSNSSFTCVDTPPIYICSCPYQQPTPPNTPQLTTSKLFDEIPVRRTDSMVSEGATSVKGNQWEETLTKIIAIIDRMQDDLTDRSIINDKTVQGKSIEVDEGTLPHHSEDISTKLVSPLSQNDSSHNESAVSVELYDLSLVGTQNLESENDKIVYKLHEKEVVSGDGITVSGDGNYVTDDGIKLPEMDGENSGIVIFLNESEDMEKTGEEGINVENSAAFQSADSDSYFIEVDYKEGEVDYSPFDISLDLYKNYGNIDGEETMLIFDPGGGKIAASNFTTAVGILELLAVMSIIQAEYKIVVNNLNQPFDHVWLERSEDGSSFIHPAEKYSVKDFLDKRIIDIKPDRPPPVENSPYKLVEEVKDLKELAATLKSVNEFAVDLEHNQYRSFQGLTCLMQISTRSEDFVVDTLKLRIHIGPYLREVFKDPKKIKVMHGADRDIIWLQRDFGIYICNLFDTGQASKVLKLERNSLEYLLNYYCGITANKEYQNADWRLRPLPMEMIRYAREDTHYLLHIYDLMRVSLLCSTNERRLCDTSLLEVYERSYDICVQLYEKDVMTDSSFLYIYGLQDANLNAQQLAVVAGLCEWRDIVARAEDESTGYILPNKTLLDIARRMPLTASSLHQLVKSKHQYVSRNLDSVVSMIRHSIHNAPAYEAIAKQLKEEYYTGVENVVVDDGCEVLSAPEVPTRSKGRIRAALIGASYASSKNLFKHLSSRLDPINNVDGVPVNQSEGQFESDGLIRDAPDRDSGLPGLPKDSSSTSEQQLASRAEANIQVLKKSTHALKALPGNSAAKRKFDPGKLEKEDVKIEQQIKSSASLPLRSLSSIADELQHAVKERAKPLEILYHQEPDTLVASDSRLQNSILLNDSIGKEQVDKDHKLDQNTSSNFASGFEMDDGDELMSLSDLSSSFKKCFQSTHQEGKAMQVRKFQEPIRPYKPYGYATARKQVGYEGRNNKEDGVNRSKRDAGSNKKKLASGHSDSAGQKAPDFFTTLL